MDQVTVREIMEVTGKSRSTIYGHLGILRDRGWLLFNSAHYSWLTVEFCGGADAEKAVDNTVDNLSRYLDSSIKEEVKELKDFNNLPPEVNNHSLSGEVVRKSGQVSRNLDKRGGEVEPTPLPPSTEGARKTPSTEGVEKQAEGARKTPSTEGVETASNNGWHDVIGSNLEGKLERLGVFAPVYSQVAAVIRSGKWTAEQVTALADRVIEDGEGAGVFVYRLRNNIRALSAQEKQDLEREKFRRFYRQQKEVKREEAG